MKVSEIISEGLFFGVKIIIVSFFIGSIIKAYWPSVATSFMPGMVEAGLVSVKVSLFDSCYLGCMICIIYSFLTSLNKK